MIPLRPRRLIGRHRELREVVESIALSPVTTLTGPGGVGKTALAIAVAAACGGDFPDGVTVAWLGSVRSPELVPAEVAAQLELLVARTRSRGRRAVNAARSSASISMSTAPR
jgi:predicted ATPase